MQSLRAMVHAATAVVLLCVIITACSASQTIEEAAPQASAAVPGDRSGEEIFAATCAACHGADGEGAEHWKVRDADGLLPAPPLNGDGHTWHHGDGLLYRIVREGGGIFGSRSNMPAFGEELTHEEIIAVLEYVKSLWDGKTIDGLAIRNTQRELSAVHPYPAGN